ncbi:hypothetical protein PO124_34965 [Bacillus licheniformis]|nr:hypothetical protein [Bacillus licheniformis]
MLQLFGVCARICDAAAISSIEASCSWVAALTVCVLPAAVSATSLTPEIAVSISLVPAVRFSPSLSHH